MAKLESAPVSESRRTDPTRGALARDSSWPLKITIASALPEINSISVTYSIDWEDCDASVEWFIAKFNQAATLDKFGPLPVSSREGLTWLAIMRKKNYALRVILHERRADGIYVSTPEEEGVPQYLFYGPRAEIKMRCASLEIVEAYLQTLYSDGITCTEKKYIYLVRPQRGPGFTGQRPEGPPYGGVQDLRK
jgi:hypothetical protein